MSRVAKKPIALPKGIEFNVTAERLTIKGPKGSLSMARPGGVEFKIDNGEIQVAPAAAQNIPLAGTARAIIANMVKGVSEGFERRLDLVGVGYRAAMQGGDLSLSLGFSHPVLFKAPQGVSIETPTQTEIVVKGTDKQQVGEVAAKIRGFRPPEPYKGKGVRYRGERIIQKEAKKA